MSVQTIKELVSRELLAWNEGRIEVINEIFAPTYVNHFTGETPAALKQKVAAVRVAFPDVQVAIDDQMVEGDRVVSRWTARGTQEGEFMGAPATHKRMEQTGISIMRVQEVKIVEGWSRADDLGLLQQLGALPPWPPPVKTFQGMADEAHRTVPTLKAVDLQRRPDKEPALLVIDVRDAAEVAQTGMIPGAINLSYGALTYLADHAAPEDWRDPRLADHARPIVTTCGLGPLGALGSKLLHDMGFSNVHILEGGVQAWIDAGLPVKK